LQTNQTGTKLWGKVNRAYSQNQSKLKKVNQQVKGLEKQQSRYNEVNGKGANVNLDHIVLGKNGLFVLETKHLKSLIKVEGDLWIGYGGKELEFSPSLQLKRNIVELKKFLGKRKQKFWVDEAVIFTNPEVELYIVSPTVRILKPNELINWIKSRDYHILKKEEIEEIREKLINWAKFV
jgi:hypothetical protein